MSELLIFMGCIVMVGSFYWLYEMIKARYIVRKFFNKMDQVNFLYGLYTFSEYGKIAEEKVDVSFKLDVTTEDIEYFLDFVQETISYCDNNCLRDFQVELIDKSYYELLEIATELRRWLWVNTTK
ncbi:MAG: hypothetical protein J6D03_03095 [Clostridia bacterium]|nr:hypothetical protein [Clostridia bacterium]